MLVLARGRFGPAPARILEQVRRGGTITREELARLTGLSPATVARTLGVLVEERLVRERPDLLPGGGIGRPSVPVEIDPGRHVALGVHVGRRTTTVGLVDLTGRLVAQRRSPTGSDPDDVVAGVVSAATRLLAGFPDRSLLSAGLVAPWDAIGHDQADLVARLEAGTGLQVSAANHVAAVAAADYLAKRQGAGGCTAYFYARDTVGFALATDLPDRTEISRVSVLTHFPTRSDVLCSCGARGCLEAVASDDALAERAHLQGLTASVDVEALRATARAGDQHAHRLLCERARVLGATTAVLRDMVAPDRVVLVGQAFTGYPAALDEVVAGFDATTVLPPLRLSFTRFGTGVQAVAAGTVGLGPIYEDPFHSVGRTTGPTRGLESLTCRPTRSQARA